MFSSEHGSMSHQKKHMTATSFLTLAILLSVTLLTAGASADDSLSRKDGDEVSVSIQQQSLYLMSNHASPKKANAYEVELLDGQRVLIQYDNKEQTMTAENETVGMLLERAGIEPSPLDMVGVTLSGDPVEVSIGHEVVTYETEKEVTPSPVTYRYNALKPSWSETVIKQGQDGVHTKVYEVIYSGGEEISRQLVEDTTTEATETIIEKGTLDNFAENQTKVTEIIENGDGTGTLVLENGQTVTFNQKRVMEATAYTTGDPGVGTVTATGTTVRLGTVGINPRSIPYGTKMYIVSNDGAYVYGFSRAEDTGALGSNRVDLYMNSYYDCIQFGRRDCTVYILD